MLAYFNVFNHPLKKGEIARFLDHPFADAQISDALKALMEAGIIFKKEDFYLLHDNTAFINQRKKGNARAEKQLVVAEKIAAILSGFPYVRGVMVSGSLSKGISNRNSDIDFFIITAGNRLWIARTIMHIFKKIMKLFRKEHLFCMNYYVDETALEIKEKNIFTAMEAATVLPFRTGRRYGDFLQANKWIENYFYSVQTDKRVIREIKSTFLKRATEKMFNSRIGSWLDDRLMKITIKRWEHKGYKSKVNYAGEILGMDAGKHYTKPDPANLQQKILHRYQLKQQELQYLLKERLSGFTQPVFVEK